jgi:hypothetical protein
MKLFEQNASGGQSALEIFNLVVNSISKVALQSSGALLVSF